MIEPGPELDAAIAREVMRWQSLGAHLWQDRETGTVYFTGFDPKRVFVPHEVWRPSRDALQAALVEQRMLRERRIAYIDALIAVVDLEIDTVMAAMEQGYPAPQHAPVVQRALLNATPAQRCQAALDAVKV